MELLEDATGRAVDSEGAALDTTLGSSAFFEAVNLLSSGFEICLQDLDAIVAINSLSSPL